MELCWLEVKIIFFFAFQPAKGTKASVLNSWIDIPKTPEETVILAQQKSSKEFCANSGATLQILS